MLFFTTLDYNKNWKDYISKNQISFLLILMVNPPTTLTLNPLQCIERFPPQWCLLHTIMDSHRPLPIVLSKSGQTVFRINWFLRWIYFQRKSDGADAGVVRIGFSSIPMIFLNLTYKNNILYQNNLYVPRLIHHRFRGHPIRWTLQI